MEAVADRRVECRMSRSYRPVRPRHSMVDIARSASLHWSCPSAHSPCGGMPSSPHFQDVQHQILLSHPFIQRTLPVPAPSVQTAKPAVISKFPPTQPASPPKQEARVFRTVPPPNSYPIALGHPAFPSWTSTWGQVTKPLPASSSPKVLEKPKPSAPVVEIPASPFQTVRAHLTGPVSAPGAPAEAAKEVKDPPVPAATVTSPPSPLFVLSNIATARPAPSVGTRDGHPEAVPQAASPKKTGKSVTQPADDNPPYCIETVTHASHNVLLHTLDHIAILCSLLVLLILFVVHLAITVVALPAALLADWAVLVLGVLFSLLTARCISDSKRATMPALTQQVWQWATRSVWVWDTIGAITGQRHLYGAGRQPDGSGDARRRRRTAVHERRKEEWKRDRSSGRQKRQERQSVALVAAEV